MQAFRLLLAVATLGALLVAVPPPEAAACAADLEAHGCAFDKGLGNGECEHFLKNPAGVVDDPCWCDKCRNGISGQHHDGHTIPKGWNAQLFETGGMDAYLKRHSVAWGITCSACMANETAPWPDGDGKNLGTVPAKDWAGKPARQTVQQRLDAESRFFTKPEGVVVAYDKHFYIATDMEGLKVRMPSGTSRLISTHEWAHLMIERAEYARREWERTLGPLMTETQRTDAVGAIPVLPIAMFFTNKERDQERIAGTYFKGPTMKGLKGAGASCVMCGGMCLSGFGGTKEKLGEDRELVAWMRHRLAHNLMVLWGSWQTRPRSLPVWMDEGVAQWLTKSVEQYRDDAVFCVGEGASTSGSGPQYNQKAWDKDAAKLAGSAKLRPIEELLGKTVLTEFTEDDWKRSWSYCDLCLSEWREPFVKMLAALRQEKDVREAFMSNLGCTPEVFDERWRDRVLGRRKSMATTAADGESEANDAPGARDRRAIRTETDPKILAAKIRQLGEVKDAKTISVVMDVMAQNADLPRETALVTLLRTKDPACLEAIASYGLAHSDGIVRAYTARICGRLAIRSALPKLEAQLADSNWYARAEAAVACGTMKDVGALPALRKMVSGDSSAKAQVGALDALAMFKEDAATAAPLIAKLLDSAQWQVRIATAQALGEIGQMESVDALISRMEKETGRLPEEIQEALKKITRDDLGKKPENWRKWWDRLKADTQGGIPKRPDAPAEKPKPAGPDPNDPHATHEGAPPPYFGLEIYSSRVAFICDTSESMLTLFTPDPAAAKALSRDYGATHDKLSICKEEIALTLQGLDPRAHFNVVAFGTQIRSFKENPVPASPGNITAAIDFLKSLPGAGETNYYDALKAALDIGAEPDTNSDFRATPDTITFLTDGEPTKGDIIDADTLLEWYTGLNRYARVKTHTITFGLINVDMPLLRGMAERNGGRFTIVPEKKRK